MTPSLLCLLDQEDSASLPWALPALKALSQRWQLQVLCPPEQAGFLDALPWLTTPVLSAASPWHWPALLATLRRQHYQQLWDLSPGPLPPWRQLLPMLLKADHKLLLADSSPFRGPSRLPWHAQHHLGERFSQALATQALSPDHHWLPTGTEQPLFAAIAERPILAVNLLDDDGLVFMPLAERFREVLAGVAKVAVVLLHPKPRQLDDVQSPRLFAIDEDAPPLLAWQVLARAQSLFGVDSAWVQRAAVLGTPQLALFPEDQGYIERWHPNDFNAVIWRLAAGEGLPLKDLLAKLRKLQRTMAEPTLNLI
ncbi:glycosyltransferase family 9 protein [Gallaecimonas sp. GXIMD1310]|uniref:glycosyltransferase family 9 protein n=1 Tax=Gallaecimonas sp. GXIMD1310 TaxID=3131926 RepID=UPI00324D6952